MKFCCFIGHRNIKETEELYSEIIKTVAYLIKEQGVEYFCFGSASRFDDVCLKIVSEIKKTYPHIKRVYVRASEQYLSKERQKRILESYDDTIMPSGIENGGKAVYVKRNQAMIDACEFCIFYYDENYKWPKSGTMLAYDYAVQKEKTIINLYKA